ncbi:hypothetical protein BDV93DRAFT_563263 [Ceratobasidium sp. AG-I]|nr:hypothetical protein BDV93DRAFT_563263 [Ceratobasidium sp. AG-I]
MPPAENASSLAQQRPRRQNISVPARAQQHVDSTVKLRTSRNESAAQKAAQADVDARPKPSHDDDSFIYGAPLPPPSASSSDANREDGLAQIYLQKIAIRDGDDYRAAYEAGQIRLEALMELADDPDANKLPSTNQPPNKQAASSGQDKGKSRGDGTQPESQVATNYRGITVGDTSHSVQSKYANDTVHPGSKTVKPQAPAQPPVPLKRTDTSTIYPGKGDRYPATPLTAPRRPANAQRQPINQTPTNTHTGNQGEPGRHPQGSIQHTPGSASHVSARPSANSTSRPSDQIKHARQPRASEPAPTQPLRPSDAATATANAPALARETNRTAPKTAQPASRPVQLQRTDHQQRPQQRQDHGLSNTRSDAHATRRHSQPQFNSSNSGGAVRRAKGHSDSRYTPVPMGPRQPTRSKVKPAHANAIRSRATHRPRHATHPSTPAQAAAPQVDELVHDNLDYDDDTDPDANADPDADTADDAIAAPTPQTKSQAKQAAQKSQSTIKGHDVDTQDTVKVMIEAALARIVANGTYECPPGGAGVEQPSRDDIVANAWGLACARTKKDYPFLLSHMKVIDSQVTTARSRAKQSLKPFIDKFFGFDDDTPEKNAELSKKHLDGFHQADPDHNRLSFQSEFVRRACRVYAFNGEGSLGAKYPKAFYPFPKTYVAFICTISHHIIYCYRDGPFAKENLHVPMQLAVYRRYLKSLNDFEANQANAFSRTLGEINDYCRGSLAALVSANNAAPEPTREWSPDEEEPYVCQYQEPSSDEDMQPYDDDDDPDAEGEDYGQPTAGPSNYRDAYRIEDDQDVPTDMEMDEMEVGEKPDESDDDESLVD